MIYFIQVNKITDRVEGFSSIKIEDEKFIEIEVDSNNKEFEELFKSPMIFVYKNKKFIKDLEYQKKLIEDENSIKNSSLENKFIRELAKAKIDSMQKDKIINMLVREQAKSKIEKMKAGE